MAPCPWSEYPPATISFCEEQLCGWVVEPSNAFSNIGYVLVGLAIIARSRRRTPLVFIGVISVLIGLGSFSMHGTHTRVGELMDVSAMYLMSGMGLMFAARRIWPMSSSTLILGFLAIVAVSVGVMIGLHNNGILMFAAHLTIAIVAEIYLYAKGNRLPTYRPYQMMLASFATAFFIWNLDKWKVLCRPDNHFVTGHAIWHLLTALAIFFFARGQERLLDATARAPA